MDTASRWHFADRAQARFANESEFPLRLKALRWVGRQTWLPRGQHRLLRLIAPSERIPHYFFEVPFFGHKYRGDLANHTDWLVFCYGAAPSCELFLLREVAAAIRQQRPGPVNFFDIGANVGHHSLFMARHADQVFAFEPLPELCGLIREKISLNQLDNIQLHAVGLGSKEDTLKFFPGLGSNSGMGSFLVHDNVDAGSQLELPVKAGDPYFEDQRLPRIDIMKVDVEGFEPFVFRGLAHRIASDRPVILTELTEWSRQGFGTEADFRAHFYPDARMAAVAGRHGCNFHLAAFDYASSAEVLIVPPELAGIVQQNSARGA